MILNNIPKSYKDISIRQYVEWQQANNSTLNKIELIISSIAILTKSSYEDVENFPISDLNKLNKELAWTSTNELPSELLKDTFTIGGKQIKFTLDATKLKGGQLASVLTKLKNSKESNLHNFEILHELLSSVSCEVGKEKLKPEPSYYSEMANVIYNELSIEDAYPLGVFFCEVSKNLQQGIQEYLQEELAKAKEMELQVVRDGLQLVTTWLTEMEQNGITTGN
jgi:hypothetical protein